VNEKWYENIEVDSKPPKRYTPPFRQQLAAGIRDYRKRQKLSQAELAEMVGTSQTAIGRLETGNGNPTLDSITKIVNALGFELFVLWREKP